MMKLGKGLSVLLVLLCSHGIAAEELPVWEAGVGVGALTMSHYMGADQSTDYGLAYPYMVYRSEYLRADRKGLRGKLFQRDDLQLSVSMNFSLPVDSDDNHTREGMPDLDPLIEFGPSLQYKMFQTNDHRHTVTLELPMRAALVIDGLDISHQGWVANPEVTYAGEFSNWRHAISAGPIFADHRYHEYYYEVDSEYETNERASYAAKAGYTGAKLSLSVRRQFGDMTVAGFVRYVNLNGAANEDSPLVKVNDYFAYGIAIHWRLAKSSRTIDLTSDF
ncbi:hypothetical protein A9Q99_21980 [Gammaproteobacteria bacterium 45_16_T64]|nr:hypothetical protein A9Q99_21980 [Gammaproteobacteria bacterium 45_16_T64]